MTNELESENAVSLGPTGRTLCLVGAALGAIGLAGWFVNSEIVTTFIAGRPAMMPNTALSLLMLGSRPRYLHA